MLAVDIMNSKYKVNNNDDSIVGDDKDNTNNDNYNNDNDQNNNNDDNGNIIIIVNISIIIEIIITIISNQGVLWSVAQKIHKSHCMLLIDEFAYDIYICKYKNWKFAMVFRVLLTKEQANFKSF